MITGFLKKHRAAIIITGSYILLMLFLYLLIPRPAPVRRETTKLLPSCLIKAKARTGLMTIFMKMFFRMMAVSPIWKH